ncbi:hypothetical protein SCACP_37460 [Sporomusa carbonis]
MTKRIGQMSGRGGFDLFGLIIKLRVLIGTEASYFSERQYFYLL